MSGNPVFSVIPEAVFSKRMQDTVLPELLSVQEELTLSREPGRGLHVLHFPGQKPRGVVLVSHGFTESAEKFRELAWYLLGLGYSVFLYDHAGHGKSYRLNSDPCLVYIDRWETYVKDLLFVADQARERYPGLPLAVFGHSMGGGIAAAAAAEGDGRFARVVLSSPMIRPLLPMPAPAASLLTGSMKLLRRYAAALPGYHPFDGSETFEQSVGLSPSRFAWYLDLQKHTPALQTCAPSFGWVGEALRLNHFLLAKAPQMIHAPVLLLQAGRETLVSNEAQDKFVSLVSGAEKLVFEKAKHEIYRSREDILQPYMEAILKFLADGKAE